MSVLRFEIYKEASGASQGLLAIPAQWRWRLRAANNRIIANSGEGYYNKEDCIHAINLVKSTTGNTPVEEVRG